MDFKKIITFYDGRKFVIEEDHPSVGAYLYIFQGKICIKDYLQNDINLCKEVALEEYNVPLDSWKINKNE